MTATLPTRRTLTSTLHPVDMRCSTGVLRPPDGTSGDGRCQLLAGHHGAHAVMFTEGPGRAVLVWHGHDEPTQVGEGWQQLPWMRGYPVPAWYEGPADLDHVSAAGARL